MHLHKKIISLLALILFLNSCDKEINIIESFPFEVSITGNKKISLSESLNSQITIKPERLVNGTTYSFSYFSEGNGAYSIDGNIIPEGKEYELDSLVQNLTYTPTIDGKHIVNFDFKDSNGNTEKAELNYSVSKDITDFDFLFEPVSEINTVGSSVNLVLDITQTSNESLNYTMDIRGQSGELIFRKKESIPGYINNISKGRYNLSFIPTSVSNNDFVVTLSASNGIRKTKRVKFKSTPVEFDFNLSKSKIFLSNSISNELVSITLDRPTLKELRVQPNYYLTIQTDTNNIFLNGKYSFGSIIPLKEFTGITNETFTYSFNRAGRSNKLIGGKITFIINNDTGFKISKSIDVEILE